MEKINKNTIKYIAYSLVGILIISYFIYQVVQMNTNPYKTELALERDIQTTVSADAFIVRDEAYIVTETSNGTVVSIAEDGKRVGSGEPVAVVFPSAESAAAYSPLYTVWVMLFSAKMAAHWGGVYPKISTG